MRRPAAWEGTSKERGIAGADCTRCPGEGRELPGAITPKDISPSIENEPDLLHPEDNRTATPRDAELDQYVDAFRLSSTRSRVALYVVIVATALIGLTQYNLQPDNWPLMRIETWFRYPVAGGTIPQEIFGGDAKLLQLAREEYLRQFIARNVFTSSPLPGVSIDVNDVGIFGGAALILLMLVLLVCLMREHENLYLALYKVRQLARLRGHEHGTSEANLLYHALVMSQVLASPPTLARWHNRGFLRHFGPIYLAPSAVYVWVVLKNEATIERAKVYVTADTVDRFMRVQWAIAAVLAVLTVLAMLNSRAMSKRWESAFRSINPVRRRLPQMSLFEWLRIQMPRLPLLQRLTVTPLCHARTVTEIVDTFRAPQPEKVSVAIHEAWLLVKRDRITSSQMQAMTRKICRRGRNAAKRWIKANDRTGHPKLLAFTATSNCIDGPFWKITGTWEFEIEP